MQIDFHHAVTYVTARLAGFSHQKARVVAYCAQYVDDATNAGLIRFQNSTALYYRIASAHKLLDYRNFRMLENHRVWIPFHFLPANGGLPAGADPKLDLVQKLICLPGRRSYVARDVIRHCIDDRDKPHALHRLGITMHVYADSWAHQGFAGISNKVNDTHLIKSNFVRRDKKLLERLANFFVGEALPLGHGTVLSYPDRPYLVWQYRDSHHRTVRRDNPKDFLEAADFMCRAMRCYIEGDSEADLEGVDGLPAADARRISRMFRTHRRDEGADRHDVWLQAIADGVFSFGSARLGYVPKGRGSWKYRALGTKEWVDRSTDEFRYERSFLQSDWKMFHDALQAHRLEVLHQILPRYGICAA